MSTRWWIAWTILCSILAFVLGERFAHAHSLTELRKNQTSESQETQSVCPVPNFDQPSKLIGAGYDIVAKIYWRIFDRNGDLRGYYYVEYELSRVTTDEHGPKITIRPFPFHYYVDTDHDGFYDQFYRDVKGDGRCQDVIPYEPANRDPKDR